MRRVACLAIALALGAEGIQMGTRFLATREATVHERYKQAIVDATDTGTIMRGRTTGPQFRALKNQLAEKVLGMEREGRPRQEIDDLTIGSLRKAVVEGDTVWGSVMMGQVAGMIREIRPTGDMLDQMVSSALDEIRALARYLGRLAESVKAYVQCQGVTPFLQFLQRVSEELI